MQNDRQKVKIILDMTNEWITMERINKIRHTRETIIYIEKPEIVERQMKKANQLIFLVCGLVLGAWRVKKLTAKLWVSYFLSPHILRTTIFSSSNINIISTKYTSLYYFIRKQAVSSKERKFYQLFDIYLSSILLCGEELTKTKQSRRCA